MPATDTVFISYAWENDDFRERVKALRDYLKKSGINVVTDFDHAIKAPTIGWPNWMQQAIEDAKVVLVVCSPLYKARFEKRAAPDSGKGVTWEGAIITQALYNATQRNDKFFPIFPLKVDMANCPLALEPWSNGHVFPDDQHKIFALIQECLGLPASPSPTNTSTTNPYQPWKPASGAHFFGREDLLRALQSALEQNRSISLVGDRRMGKTSLLQMWQEKARVLGRKVVLLDGTRGEAVSCAAFAKAITGNDIEQDNADQAVDAIDQWLTTHSALAPLLLLDEAEKFIVDLPHRLFERLRGLISYQKICLVLATATEVEDVYRDTGQTSPFLNLLEMRRIALLDPAAAAQVLALGDGALGDTQTEFMRRWAGRHPYFLALAGQRLWDAAEQGIALADVEDQLNDEAKGRMQELWQTLSEREKQALRACLRREAGAPASLRLRGLLVREGGGEQIFGDVLASWLREYA